MLLSRFPPSFYPEQAREMLWSFVPWSNWWFFFHLQTSGSRFIQEFLDVKRFLNIDDWTITNIKPPIFKRESRRLQILSLISVPGKLAEDITKDWTCRRTSGEESPWILTTLIKKCQQRNTEAGGTSAEMPLGSAPTEMQALEWGGRAGMLGLILDSAGERHHLSVLPCRKTSS